MGYPILTTPGDDFESYADGSVLNAKNGGFGGTSPTFLTWGGKYFDRLNYTGVKATDDFESYADGAAVDGLNGGTGFSGAYVDRTNT